MGGNSSISALKHLGVGMESNQRVGIKLIINIQIYVGDVIELKNNRTLLCDNGSIIKII